MATDDGDFATCQACESCYTCEVCVQTVALDPPSIEEFIGFTREGDRVFWNEDGSVGVSYPDIHQRKSVWWWLWYL